MEEDFTEILSEQIEERKRQQEDYTETVREETAKQLAIAEDAKNRMQQIARDYQAAMASMNMSGGGSTTTNSNNTNTFTVNQNINNPIDAQATVQQLDILYRKTSV